jgi:5-methylcytosine-specific restriction endonuclease McrA
LIEVIVTRNRKSRKRREALNKKVVKSDSSFSLNEAGLWEGNCLMCNGKLYCDTHGKLLPPATLEHIMPRTRGGDDDPSNLAIACNKCNNEKALRHDKSRRGREARAQEVIHNLLEKRKKRWRDPDGMV